MTLKGKVHRVRKEVVELARYAPLRAAFGGLTKPLSEPDIKALGIRETNRRSSKVIDVITRDDAPILSAPVPLPVVPGSEQQFSGKRTAVLQIIRPTLVGDMTWTFSEGEGTSPISIPIADADFLAQRDRGEAFRSGDFMEVEIAWETTISGSRHTTKQSIVRVVRHIERPIQATLPLPPAG